MAYELLDDEVDVVVDEADIVELVTAGVAVAIASGELIAMYNIH